MAKRPSGQRKWRGVPACGEYSGLTAAVPYGPQSLPLLCCHLCCVASAIALCWLLSDTREKERTGGRHQAFPGKLQREFRRGAHSVADGVFCSDAAHSGLSLPPRWTSALRLVRWHLPYGALRAGPRMLHAVPAALWRCGAGDHLRYSSAVGAAELCERHCEGRPAGGVPARLQRGVLRAARLHRRTPFAPALRVVGADRTCRLRIH